MKRKTAAVPLVLVVVAAAYMAAPFAQAPQGRGAPGVQGGRGGRGGRRAGGPPRARAQKVVLAWADTRNGSAQHESVSHALSVIEQLGYESGAYDTFIRTDSNIIAKQHLPASLVVRDEHYQLKGFSPDTVHVLARLDPGALDLRAPLVHRRDGQFPVAYTKTYGKGRVFYSTLGRPAELWDEPWLQKMYFEALRWTMEREGAR
jgi:Trehalose utilisation